MRLHPAVTPEEAMAGLLSQLADLGYKDVDDDLRKVVKQMAETMAAVSAVALPDELEPLFP